MHPKSLITQSFTLQKIVLPCNVNLSYFWKTRNQISRTWLFDKSLLAIHNSPKERIYSSTKKSLNFFLYTFITTQGQKQRPSNVLYFEHTKNVTLYVTIKQTPNHLEDS